MFLKGEICMDIRYSKIFNFNRKQATKLENSSYLEELTGLIAKVASSLDDESKYCFDKKYYLDKPDESPNSSYEEFIKNFKNDFNYSSSNKIIVIRGQAGIGKTLFFKKGAQTLLGNQEDRFNKYIHLGVDFKNIDSKQSIEYYKEFIFKNLRDDAIFAIRQASSDVAKEFYKEYKEYCDVLSDTPDAKFFPVMYFCKYIYEKYNKPCLIVFDNIDLACVETQKRVFQATSIFISKFNTFMETQNCKDIYRVCFAMRPETHLRSQEVRVGNVINFPLPNIQKICLDIIKEKLIETAEAFDKDETLKCEVTYFSIIDQEQKTAKTFLDVAKYFVEIFEHYLKYLWDNDEIKQRLCSNEVFHCRIVNYNVRKFLCFLSDTLSNGGFKPLTKDFNKNNNGGYYNVYDYIEMIIRGRWEVHPGNFHIDGEGGNKAPIVFNVFDTSLWQNRTKQSIKHFMLYIRILQYLNIYSKNEDLVYEHLEEELSCFFDKESILKAVKALVFVRIIYSFHEGDDNVASKHNLEEVVITENTPLYLSPTGKFYLENLICEFEYIYQMSLSSLMPEPYVEELKSRWKNEKELTVLRFLTGVFYIIQDNLDSYDEDTLNAFISAFCMEDEISCRPYRRMLNSFITAMNNKVQRAEKFESRSLCKLQEILEQAKKLQIDAETYFKEKLGE